MPSSSRLNLSTALFLLLLGFHALFQLGFFAQLTFTPGSVLEAAGLSVDLAPSPAGLLTLAAAGQALLVVLSVHVMILVWRDAAAGDAIAITIGAYFLLLGIALAFIGSLQFAVIDIIRGALTVLAGIWWGRGRASRTLAA
jgi:hypothetical protein